MTLRRWFALGIIVAAGVMAYRQLLAGGWLIAAAILIFGLLFAWLIGQCPHTGHCALLPAVTNFYGQSLPARWYCDTCGKDWPANIDRPQTPIQKFTGHDESKAVQAATRAEIEQQNRRVLAMKRAGEPAPKRPVKVVPNIRAVSR